MISGILSAKVLRIYIYLIIEVLICLEQKGIASLVGHDGKDAGCKYCNSKVLNTVRVAGKIAFVAGIAATAYDVGADINEGKFKSAGARAAVSGVAAGAAFIPIVGWGVAAGIGVADYVWGDEFYNWVEK